MYTEKMSNEELAQALDGFDIGELSTIAYEAARRLRTGMNWLPMTPDAVFEDGEAYLLWDGNDGTVELGTWLQYQYGFDVKDGHYIEDRKYYTHYARITEPNK